MRVIGLPVENLRKLPSDAAFRLPIRELTQWIERDRAAGKRPFCVIASAGTTNTGAIDPLRALAQLCREQGLWLHVDGAYGAAAVIAGRGRELLAGLELADSLSLDPHKWLFQPYEMGCCWCAIASTCAKRSGFCRSISRTLIYTPRSSTSPITESSSLEVSAR